MNKAYAALTPDKAQEAIHEIILAIYRGPDPSKEKVNAELMKKFGIKLFVYGFNVKMITKANGKLEVRCTFKAPSPDGKGVVGIWV